MRTVRISDTTLKQEAYTKQSFREKLEVIKLLDKLNADVIEVEGIKQPKSDGICLKAYAQTIENGILAVPVALSDEGVSDVWNAVSLAKKPRLQVLVPTSSVQMEYLYHLKAEGMKALAVKTVAACKKCCNDVELVAIDATRGDLNYLAALATEAAAAGATVITLCDTAGNLLPDEFKQFLTELKAKTDAFEKAALGVCCSSQLSAAEMCAFTAVLEGAGEVKASVSEENTVSLPRFVSLLEKKGEAFGVSTSVKTIEIGKLTEKIRQFSLQKKGTDIPVENPRSDKQENVFTVNEPLESLVKEISRLGYDLAPEDITAVYDAFLRIAGKKGQVTTKELEAIIATTALDVTPVYKMESYVINSGNTISATSHIRLSKGGEILEGVSVGDGAVDASFRAIETIIGRHYELDDFQIQAVTEGREAMGETIVRLRSGGKLYSGRGISTDIVGSSIRAYMNALNKIAYEEEHS